MLESGGGGRATWAHDGREYSLRTGLGSGWKVVKSEMDVEGRHLPAAGSQFACAECWEYCPVHATVEKTWRHLNFWQHEAHLTAECRAPNARSTECCRRR